MSTPTSHNEASVKRTATRRSKAEKFRKELELLCFDGYAVFRALNESEKRRTSAENVADTLNALVRLARAQK